MGGILKLLRDAGSTGSLHAGWHRQALALKTEAARTPSGALARLLLEESERVVRSRTATKKV